MSDSIKMTKAMYFAKLREMVEENWTEDKDKDELLGFIDNELAILEKRKAAASERAAKKRAESDALTDKIYEALGDEPMTIDEILEAVAEGDESITRNKVTARLSKLVKAEKVAKESIKIDGNKRMAYSRA